MLEKTVAQVSHNIERKKSQCQRHIYINFILFTKIKTSFTAISYELTKTQLTWSKGLNIKNSSEKTKLAKLIKN